MLDIIILSKASDEAHFQLVKRCIESFLQEEQYITNIVVVESNKQFDTSKWSSVSPKIKTVIPPYKFNYNQFLNIGLEYCTSDIVCISNSDVEVQKGCVETMLVTFNKVKKVMSASPIDRTWHQNSYNIFPKDNQIYVGYDTTKFLLGFCLFMRRSLFDIIGPFDERFHFYHQDNDYEMCLRKHELVHVINTYCHIRHGHDKPESETTEQETHQMLRESQAVFLKKWNGVSLKDAFVKYKKLSIITSRNDITSNSRYVEIAKDTTLATGQYTVECDRYMSASEQDFLLDILNFKPDTLSINNLLFKRNF